MISTVNPEPSTIGTVARKRRRQIMLSQRTKSGSEEISTVPPIPKRPCIEPITGTITTSRLANGPETTLKKSTVTKKTKKPQMKYDPEVPMSKEEAAAWRKEQRRKRNRESAAASRQRQRDRISELEEEVSEWKSKFEEAVARLAKLEQLKLSASNSSQTDLTAHHPATVGSVSAAVSPCSSPRISPAQIIDHSCGMVSLQDQSNCREMEGSSSVSCDEEQTQDNHVKHLSEKISRPA